MKRLIAVFGVLLITMESYGQYKEGFLVFPDGRKQKGEIKVGSSSWTVWKSKPAPVMFRFSENTAAFKVKDDVLGLMIDQDSFVYKTNIQVAPSAPPFKRDLAKFIMRGKIDLFEHYSRAATGPGGGIGPISVSITPEITTYILCKGSRCISVYKTRAQQDQILAFISDNPNLKAKLEATKPNFWNIESIVRQYNSSTP